MNTLNNELLNFLNTTHSQFHAVKHVSDMLKANGYIELFEGDNWNLEKGKGYFTTRNQSSIIAFFIPEHINNYHFQITAAHTDSPTYKLKEVVDLENDGYVKFNVEGYGGMIASTWFDRPLSVAGRVLVKKDGLIKSELVDIDQDLLMIPNLAIHMNRDINNGYKYNTQIDLLPLFSCEENNADKFYQLLADACNCQVRDILSHELFLYNREPGRIWGINQEFLSASKIDNLESTFLTTKGFIESDNNDFIKVMCSFDNEEVGSGTKQGADSTFLEDVLVRINQGLDFSQADFLQAIGRSFMLSVDNGHATHLNHPEKSDVKNGSHLNKGVVIKFAANQKYTTDGISAAIVKELCNLADAKQQIYINRSDVIGGSTLGNISNAHVSLHTADIGLAQLAMHSSYETAGSKDPEMMYRLVKYFFAHRVNIINNDTFGIDN